MISRYNEFDDSRPPHPHAGGELFFPPSSGGSLRGRSVGSDGRNFTIARGGSLVCAATGVPPSNNSGSGNTSCFPGSNNLSNLNISNKRDGRNEDDAGKGGGGPPPLLSSTSSTSSSFSSSSSCAPPPLPHLLSMQSFSPAGGIPLLPPGLHPSSLSRPLHPPRPPHPQQSFHRPLPPLPSSRPLDISPPFIFPPPHLPPQMLKGDEATAAAATVVVLGSGGERGGGGGGRGGGGGVGGDGGGGGCSDDGRPPTTSLSYGGSGGEGGGGVVESSSSSSSSSSGSKLRPLPPPLHHSRGPTTTTATTTRSQINGGQRGPPDIWERRGGGRVVGTKGGGRSRSRSPRRSLLGINGIGGGEERGMRNSSSGIRHGGGGGGDGLRNFWSCDGEREEEVVEERISREGRREVVVVSRDYPPPPLPHHQCQHQQHSSLAREDHSYNHSNSSHPPQSLFTPFYSNPSSSATPPPSVSNNAVDFDEDELYSRSIVDPLTGDISPARLKAQFVTALANHITSLRNGGSTSAASSFPPLLPTTTTTEGRREGGVGGMNGILGVGGGEKDGGGGGVVLSSSSALSLVSPSVPIASSSSFPGEKGESRGAMLMTTPTTPAGIVRNMSMDHDEMSEVSDDDDDEDTNEVVEMEMEREKKEEILSRSNSLPNERADDDDVVMISTSLPSTALDMSRIFSPGPPILAQSSSSSVAGGLLKFSSSSSSSSASPRPRFPAAAVPSPLPMSDVITNKHREKRGESGDGEEDGESSPEEGELMEVDEDALPVATTSSFIMRLPTSLSTRTSGSTTTISSSTSTSNNNSTTLLSDLSVATSCDIISSSSSVFSVPSSLSSSFSLSASYRDRKQPLPVRSSSPSPSLLSDSSDSLTRGFVSSSEFHRPSKRLRSPSSSPSSGQKSLLGPAPSSSSSPRTRSMLSSVHSEKQMTMNEGGGTNNSRLTPPLSSSSSSSDGKRDRSNEPPCWSDEENQGRSRSRDRDGTNSIRSSNRGDQHPRDANNGISGDGSSSSLSVLSSAISTVPTSTTSGGSGWSSSGSGSSSSFREKSSAAFSLLSNAVVSSSFSSSSLSSALSAVMTSSSSSAAVVSAASSSSASVSVSSVSSSSLSSSSLSLSSSGSSSSTVSLSSSVESPLTSNYSSSVAVSVSSMTSITAPPTVLSSSSSLSSLLSVLVSSSSSSSSQGLELHNVSSPLTENLPPEFIDTPVSRGKLVLLLDLDNTLLHALSQAKVGCDISMSHFVDSTGNADLYKFTLPSAAKNVYYLKLRPFVRFFLELLRPYYEMGIYTNATKEYADVILAILDPDRSLFGDRLYPNIPKRCVVTFDDRKDVWVGIPSQQVLQAEIYDFLESHKGELNAFYPPLRDTNTNSTNANIPSSPISGNSATAASHIPLGEPVYDRDYHLHYIVGVLLKLHKNFFEAGGTPRNLKTMDVGILLERRRKNVLMGLGINFTGFLKTDNPSQSIPADNLQVHRLKALEFGATVHESPDEPNVTHVVAGRNNTTRYQESRRCDLKRVHALWLWHSEARWQKAEESLFDADMLCSKFCNTPSRWPVKDHWNRAANATPPLLYNGGMAASSSSAPSSSPPLPSSVVAERIKMSLATRRKCLISAESGPSRNYLSNKSVLNNTSCLLSSTNTTSNNTTTTTNTSSSLDTIPEVLFLATGKYSDGAVIYSPFEKITIRWFPEQQTLLQKYSIEKRLADNPNSIFSSMNTNNYNSGTTATNSNTTNSNHQIAAAGSVTVGGEDDNEYMPFCNNSELFWNSFE